MKVLVVGPSIERSKGGMATVIDGIRSYFAKSPDISVSLFASYIDGPTPVRLLYSLFAWLRFILFYQGYDLYHLHMASFGSAKRKTFYIRFLKKRNKRVIVHLHGGNFFDFYGRLAPKEQQWLADALRKADMCIALSDQWKNEYEEHLGLTNINTLNNGIDPYLYAPAVPTTCDYPGRMLFLGRISRGKGVYVLLEALALLKKEGVKTVCSMAGSGEIAKVQAIIDRDGLGEMVLMLGWVDRNQMLELFKKVSIVVLPSFNEGLPMTLLEGMAAGKAIISTPVGAIPELVENGVNGILVKPGNATELAAAIRRLCENPAEVIQMAEKNVKKIQDLYSSELLYKKLSEYYMAVYSNTV